MTSSLRVVLCAMLALSGTACSSSPPSGPDCPGPRAAFHVTITAKNGPLPHDTVLEVAYGGGIEEYDLASPPSQPEVVFCHQVTAASDAGKAGHVDAGKAAGPEAGKADAGKAEAGRADGGKPDAGKPDAGNADASNADAASVTALTCDLWTNSAADINIQGSGYPALKQELQAEKDDCGIKTVNYALVLGDNDGGAQPQ